MVRAEIVNSLCLLKDDHAVQVLNKYLLKDNNEKLRYLIATTLGEIASTEAVSALATILAEKNTESLKRASQKALEKIAEKSGSSVEDLIKKHGTIKS